MCVGGVVVVIVAAKIIRGSVDIFHLGNWIQNYKLAVDNCSVYFFIAPGRHVHLSVSSTVVLMHKADFVSVTDLIYCQI